MSKKMIEIQDVSMRFRLMNDRILSMKEFITTAVRGKLVYRQFEALQHVTFTIRRGETVGIIGRNGSGKSTLLKIISGILKPTAGTVAVNGNVVPMLELGSGFDFDLTGQENVFLNGAILGYTEAFLKEKYNEIVEFSELGEFITVPIRNYSSGMLMRLAFSIAAMVEPEILIADEILAVGDDAFQKKSLNRMKQMMSGGTTVLLVSHSIEQVREMCGRVVWLDHGQVKLIGPADKVCDAYQQ
ncbi:ABC transporter ATP-binding protein [Agathobaculum sp. NTUH-O15-33]|uniref:ABC transporter ATP-binding protein n=1 Tax=Agathobaculum sp. NTUH-O15-33 TaxID=3079302 RepID=UPI003FA46739